MNAVQRFFRKYFLSTVGILLLFFAVNILLLGIVATAAYSNSNTPDIPVGQLAAMVTETGGSIHAAQAVSSTLAERDAWAMLLDDGGTVIWEERMPANLPRHYTATEIARFSRWYLQDYPVYVWEHPAGLFVVGYPPNRMLKYTISVDANDFATYGFGALAAFIVNVLLMLFLFWHSTHKVEKAVKPILTGINTMANGEPVALEERGELATLSAELNRAGAQLQKKDTARAEWIQGISHDIRTPLSIMLGYAGELEEDATLPAEVQKQAGIIRQQGETLRQLIINLNLASKLEYSMQPRKLETIDPVELARQVIADCINGGLEENKYTLHMETAAQTPGFTLQGDCFLLERMLRNLIQNSIAHNPAGCSITVGVNRQGSRCAYTVADDGTGIAEGQLKQLNAGQFVQTDGSDGVKHGWGLYLVYQIVRAHQGEITFANAQPRGLCVTILL
ncbi:MAG: HAMP domain-containing sensor histidine kinase [Gemmiger sp.]|nr:HAMP domain-containing sensor histidine kinase [Gemmiger sp.]